MCVGLGEREFEPYTLAVCDGCKCELILLMRLFCVLSVLSSR